MSQPKAIIARVDLVTPTEQTEVQIFVIRHPDTKQWYCRKTNGYDSAFVTKFQLAKVFMSLGRARGVITWFANKYPAKTLPELMQFGPNGFTVHDETARIKKMQEAHERRQIRRKQEAASREFDLAQRQLQAAQQNLKQAQAHAAAVQPPQRSVPQAAGIV